MHIVYVSDGKAGHRSQALGLYHAMQRVYPHAVSFEEVSVQDLPIYALLQGIFQGQLPQLAGAPNYIFSVGSHTQLRALLLGKIYRQAKTVVMMKPSFPRSCFDHAIIPMHDGIAQQGNVIVTQGALNPIVNEQRHQKNRILIALGGSSKRHQWQDAKVLQAIKQIVNDNPHSSIILTTSRRTPKEFLVQLTLQSFATQLQIFPVEATPQGWIFEQMQLAEAVWVTEDSVSMLYEALTSGCKVGLIEIDRLKQDRITGSIDLLLTQKKLSYVTSSLHLSKAIHLKEADRIADILL